MWFAIFSEYPWEVTNTQPFYHHALLAIGLCMVNPPKLNAAKPVGATIAQDSSPGFAFQRLSTKHFIVSMRNDFPVPPTPLINMRRG